MTPVKKMTPAGRGGAGFAEGQLISGTPTGISDNQSLIDASLQILWFGQGGFGICFDRIVVPYLEIPTSQLLAGLGATIVPHWSSYI